MPGLNVGDVMGVAKEQKELIRRDQAIPLINMNIMCRPLIHRTPGGIGVP